MQYLPKLVHAGVTVVVAVLLGVVLSRQTSYEYFDTFCVALPIAAGLTYQTAEWLTAHVDVRALSPPRISDFTCLSICQDIIRTAMTLVQQIWLYIRFVAVLFKRIAEDGKCPVFDFNS